MNQILIVGNFYQAYSKNGRKYYFYVENPDTVTLLAQSIKGIYSPLEYHTLDMAVNMLGIDSEFEEVTDLNIGWYFKRKKNVLQAYRVLYCSKDITLNSRKNLIRDESLLVQKIVEVLNKGEYPIIYVSTLGSFFREKHTEDIHYNSFS